MAMAMMMVVMACAGSVVWADAMRAANDDAPLTTGQVIVALIFGLLGAMVFYTMSCAVGVLRHQV